MRIRILLFTLMRIRILPLAFFQIWTLQCPKMNPLGIPIFHFDPDPDPDPTFHFDENPDAYPFPGFTLIRIRINLPNMMRIRIRNAGFIVDRNLRMIVA